MSKQVICKMCGHSTINPQDHKIGQVCLRCLLDYTPQGKAGLRQANGLPPQDVDLDELSRLEARRKMDKVCELVEQAQNLLGKACQELCPLTPLCDDWERLGKLYDQVHAEWHRLNLIRNGEKYDLDPDAKGRFLARVRAFEKTRAES